MSRHLPNRLQKLLLIATSYYFEYQVPIKPGRRFTGGSRYEYQEFIPGSLPGTVLPDFSMR